MVKRKIIVSEFRGEEAAKAMESIETTLDRNVCLEIGHDYDIYSVSTGNTGNDIEMAGYCLRCGYDTHGKFG